MTNYFLNFMLKYHPQLLTRKMVLEQNKCLALLKQGKKISLWAGCYIEMVAGKIRTVDQGRWE